MSKFTKNKKVFVNQDGEFRLKTVTDDWSEVMIREKHIIDEEVVGNILKLKYRVKAVAKEGQESNYIALHNEFGIPVFFDELNQYRVRTVDTNGLSSNWSSVLFYVNEYGDIAHSNESILQFIDDVLNLYTEDFLSEIFIDKLLEDNTYKKLVDDIALLITTYSDEFLDIYLEDKVESRPTLENYVQEVINSDVIIDRITTAISNFIEYDYFNVDTYDDLDIWLKPETIEDLFEYSTKDVLSHIMQNTKILDRDGSFLNSYPFAYTYDSNLDDELSLEKINAALITYLDNIIEDEITDLFISMAAKSDFTFLTDDIVTLTLMSYVSDLYDIELDNDYIFYLNCKDLIGFEESEIFNEFADISFRDNADMVFKDLIGKYQSIVRAMSIYAKVEIEDGYDILFNPQVYSMMLLYYWDELSDIEGIFGVSSDYLHDVESCVNLLTFGKKDKDGNPIIEGYLETELDNMIIDNVVKEILYYAKDLEVLDIYGFAMYIIILKMQTYWNINIEDNIKNYLNTDNYPGKFILPFGLIFEDNSLITSSYNDPECDRYSLQKREENINTLAINYEEVYYSALGDIDKVEPENYTLFDIMGKSIMGMTPMGYDGSQKLPSETKRDLRVW